MPPLRGSPNWGVLMPDGDQCQRRVARFLEIRAGVVLGRRQPVDNGVPVAGQTVRGRDEAAPGTTGIRSGCTRTSCRKGWTGRNKNARPGSGYHCPAVHSGIKFRWAPGGRCMSTGTAGPNRSGRAGPPVVLSARPRGLARSPRVRSACRWFVAVAPTARRSFGPSSWPPESAFSMLIPLPLIPGSCFQEHQ